MKTLKMYCEYRQFKVPQILMAIVLFSAATPTFCTCSLAQESIKVGTLPKDREVSFSSDVLPILRKNCIACHNATDAESDVNLETVASMRSEDSSEVLVPGDATASLIFRLAAHLEEPIMPPEGNEVSAQTLTSEELALLQRWINSGAKVDTTGPKQTKQWRALPPQVRTAFASAMTEDGNLTAVSFANRIKIFNSKSAEAYEELTVVDGSQQDSPHVDFVHALEFARDGELIFSAGYRNVGLWRRSAVTEFVTPRFSDQVVCATLSRNGAYCATFSSVGEISVAKVGEPRWSWLKGFEIHEGNVSEAKGAFQLAINNQGDLAAISHDSRLYFASSETEMVSQQVDSPISKLTFLDSNVLLAGHENGTLQVWRKPDGGWVGKQLHKLMSRVQCIAEFEDTESWAVWDDAGNFVQLDRELVVTGKGKSKEPLDSVVAVQNGAVLARTSQGAIGSFELSTSKWTEFGKHDPFAEAAFEKAKWRRMVGERLVSTLQEEEKKIRANQDAELKSLEQNKKDLEGRIKKQKEQANNVQKLESTLQMEKMKLAVKQTEQSQVEEKRKVLSERLTETDQRIDELTAQLEELKKQRETAQKELEKLPEAKALEEEIAKSEKAVEAGEKVVAAAIQSEKLAQSAVQQTEQASDRIEKRLAQIQDELAAQTELLKQEEARQSERSIVEQKSQMERDASKAVAQGLFPSFAAEAITATSGGLQKWCDIGRSTSFKLKLPQGTTVEAASGGNVLLLDPTGKRRLLSLPSRNWQLTQSLGAAAGESPFAHRVLSLSVSPDGKRLATGGGSPSRSGEVFLWSIDDDGTVSPDRQTLESPHKDTVLALSFSPDGKMLASASADRLIKLWDAESGKLIKSLEGHTHHVTGLAWSVTGRQLYSASADKSVKVWDVASAKVNRTIKGLKSEITNLISVGRDNRLAIVTGDGYFRVYRADNGALETNQKLAGGYLYGLDRDREGKQFVLSGSDGFARLVDKSGKTQTEFQSE